MTTMLEKAARAIKLELYEQEDKARRARRRTSIDTLALARVALDAIREPSGPVKYAATGDGWNHVESGIPDAIWSSAINAILNEKTT